MSGSTLYKAKQFNLSGLYSIFDKTLEMHFKLYEGYVNATNTLTAILILACKASIFGWILMVECGLASQNENC
jgi:TRAP-type C4-dicarboxylate transport system permease large subunit